MTVFSLEWSVLSSFVDSNGLSVRWADVGNNYFLHGVDGDFNIECIIKKTTPKNDDQTDFETFYKEDGNGLTGNVTSQYVPVNAILFDGVDEYVNMGDIFDQDGSSGFSISCWIKLDATAGSQGMIYSRLGSNPFPGLEIIDYISGGQSFIRVIMANNGTTNLIDKTMSNSLTRDQSIHICVTYDGTKTAAGMKIYVGDTVQATSVTHDTLSGSSSVAADVNIGRRTIGGSYFKGEMDEMSFWSKELSQSEVTEMAAEKSDLSQHSAVANLVHWYFEDFTFPTVEDMKGTDDGTMVNMEAEDIV